jgi:hypothetical protein
MAQLPSNIRVNAQFPFPSLVQGSGPVTITKQNGVWIVGWGVTQFATTVPPATDYAVDTVLVYNATTKTFFNMTLNALIGIVSGETAPTIVTAAGTYNSVTTDSRILMNKTVGAASSVVLAASAGYSGPVLVKDLKGDADTHNITVTFNGAEKADGLSSVVISTKYGAYWFNPLASGGWYITVA